VKPESGFWLHGFERIKIKESPPQDKSDEIPTTAPCRLHNQSPDPVEPGIRVYLGGRNRKSSYFSLAWTDFVANQSKANNT